MIQENCPICGGKAARLVGEKDGLRVLRCSTCTGQYSERAPEVSQLSQIYDKAYFHGSPAGYPAYEADESLHRTRSQGYLRDLMQHAAAPGSLLDVGCATGFFLDEARQAGWQVRGCEVSEWAAGYAQKRFGLDVVMAPFPTPLLGTQRYDAITFLNVFEQLPDPHGAERILRDLVAPGGLLALETWDVDALVVRMSGMKWHKYRPEETPIYLNRQSLTTLFTPEHWTLVEYRARTKWITLAHGLHALGLAGHPSNGGTPRHSLRDRLGRLSLPYHLGDLVWAVMKRREDART
jgi:SAM-dependent methyltransferase